MPQSMPQVLTPAFIIWVNRTEDGRHGIGQRNSHSDVEENWDNYEATIYTDGAATYDNANGGSSIIASTGPWSDPAVHRLYTIQAGKWCSSYKAEDKYVRTNLKQVGRIFASTIIASLRIVC